MANEKRLIDANALEKDMRAYADNKAYCGHYELANGILKAVGRIDEAPTVDAVEVVHGRWVEHRPNVYECTACNTWYGNYGGCEEWAYCPNCGAKMDGDGNGN